MLDLVYTFSIKGREHCLLVGSFFFTYNFDIDQCQGTCEMICLKLGMMLGTTEFHIMIPVWIAVTLCQGHRVTGKLELLQFLGVQSVCCKDTDSNQTVHDGWL